MELLLRVTRDSLPASRDVVVACDEHHTVADLCAALTRHLGTDVPSLSSRHAMHQLGASMPLVACGLASGDEVAIGDGSSDVGDGPPTAVCAIVEVTAGPDAGRSGHVGGRAVVGRSATADFVLCDPTVSRRHIEVSCDGTQVVVHPTDPIGRAVAVNARAIARATKVTDGDEITIGGTRLTVRQVVDPDRRSPVRGGVPFRRTPRRPPPVLDTRTITVGPTPGEREDRDVSRC